MDPGLQRPGSAIRQPRAVQRPGALAEPCELRQETLQASATDAEGLRDRVVQNSTAVCAATKRVVHAVPGSKQTRGDPHSPDAGEPPDQKVSTPSRSIGPAPRAGRLDQEYAQRSHPFPGDRYAH